MDKDKLTKILIMTWVLLILSLGIIAYMTTVRWREIDKSIEYVNNYPFGQIIKEEVRLATEHLKQPKDGIDGVNGQDGSNGMNGKDSVSTKTVIVEQVPVNGENGEDGEDARQIEACTSKTVPFGWRYVGTITCLFPLVEEEN